LSNDLVLVIDLGTQSMRGTAVDRDGRVHFSRTYPIHTDREGARCEQDPRVWRGCLENIVTEARGAHGESIRATVATGTLSGLVCVDGNGEALGPAIMYGDQRSCMQAARIEADPAFPNWGGWRAHSCDFLPQLLYLAEEQGHVYGRAKHVLDATGYLNYLLTGEATMDAYTRFHCYANPGGEGLPEGLFSNLGLDRMKLGDVHTMGQRIGNSDVIAASYDSVCAYQGAGLSRPGDALDISGTVTSFGVLQDGVVADDRRRVYSLPWNDGQWLLRGSTAMSGGVLEWVLREIVRGEFDEFDGLVGESRPGANGVIFLPFLAGERAPIWNEKACGTFFGLTPATTRADLARAVYEGLCYSLRHIQSVVEELGAAVGTVRIAGGLARNDTLTRIKADITGKALRPMRNLELTTLGCVAIAGCALGWYESMEESQQHLLSFCPDVEPDSKLQSKYDEGFERYRKLVEVLEPVFR
jgi:xylulokinase